jgi:hypothetical protein
MGKPIRILLILGAICLSQGAWTPASACSFASEYVPPSDFELVQLADAVVIATVRGGRGNDTSSFVRFAIAERVKGILPAEVEAYGILAPPPGGPQLLVMSSPEGHQGPCDLRIFREGHRYLLFLERSGEGNLLRVAHAYSRADEDYSARRDPWVAMVRRYVSLQAKASPMEQIAILERMLKTGRDSSGAPLGADEATGVSEHLASLSPYKPTPYLLSAYAALDGGGTRPEGGPAAPSAPATAARQLVARERGYGADGVGRARRQILVALVNGDHPDARPLFEQLAGAAAQDPSTWGLIVRYFAKNGAYGRALAWIETRLMATLPLLEPRAAKRLIADVAKAQGGDEGSERWRSDPHAAAVWPELALALYWYQVQRFGADDSVLFPEAIRALPHADPRARPPVTLALAHDYEAGIAEWAVAELRDAAKRRAWEALPQKERQGMEDPALLPLQVLLAGWTADDAKVVGELYCQSEGRRLLLIDTLGDSAGILYGGLLTDMAASDLSAEARDRLAHATLKYAARERRMIDDDDVGKGLLPRIVSRERLPGKGITCPSAAG